MTVQTKPDGYDIIGDIHGCAAELEALLHRMGYRQDDAGTYRHPARQAIFVGDLIDSGPQQKRVLQVVKAMVDAGTALMVLGNHEFNAMAYHTEWPDRPGKFMRPHDDPDDEWSAKNEKQHGAFLAQLSAEEQSEYVGWFWTQPLWLDLGELRVVHACWDAESLAIVANALGGNRFRTVEQLGRASTKGDPLYIAVETILKGPEISLTDHGQPAYRDKGGFRRDHARLRWWDGEAGTLRDLAEINATFTTEDHEPYPPLPETPITDRHVYTDRIPVFYGHYWRRDTPTPREDWTEYAACVDFSAVKDGTLTAYRWSGEGRIRPDNYVQLPAS